MKRIIIAGIHTEVGKSVIAAIVTDPMRHASRPRLGE
jgi:dethiobiotin synthetase